MIDIKALFTLILLLIVSSIIVSQDRMPPSLQESAVEPVIYNGKLQPEKEFYDGKLPHAVGVHHYQVFRANRKNPADPGKIGFTYNHQPYLSYWKGKFYLQFLQGLVEEHAPPTRIVMVTSENGLTWNDPVIAFPEYTLPEIDDDVRLVRAGTKSVMHQRMGFYVAPNGILLISGFYSYTATPRNSPNAGQGIGRVIREVNEDGSFGPIYFIRYNRHAGWNEDNTNFPFYKTSNDQEFLEACDALMKDKLATLQWWEEDRSEDGFYTIDPFETEGSESFSKYVVTTRGAGKALSYYSRPDDVIVALWKNQYSALSPDRGKTWTKIVKNKTLWSAGSKTWGQRTDDGRFAIVHNQSATKRNRFPMVAMVGADGHIFDRMVCLRSEISPLRYQGIHKNPGPQYYRGIIEGNGNPPGDEMWIAYSMNKEDIWISSTAVPIKAMVENEIDQDFESINSISDLQMWNIYHYKWATVDIEVDPKTNNRHLRLTDEDPYDGAMAERIFPKASNKDISFRFNAKQVGIGYAMHIEVQDQRGSRALALRIDNDWLSFDLKKIEVEAVPISTNAWYLVNLKIDCVAKNYTVSVNGIELKEKIKFADNTDNVERIIFRTYPYRGYVPTQYIEHGTPGQNGLDIESLAGSEEKVPASVYLIDDLFTGGY